MTDDDLGTVRWFGRSWGAPINDPRAEIEVPVGAQCISCNVMFEDYHRGVRIPWAAATMEEYRQREASGDLYTYYHLDCWMRSIGFGDTH